MPLGAPVPTKIASKPSASSFFMLSMRWPSLSCAPMPMMSLISRSSTSAGRRNDGMLRAHQAARDRQALEDHHVVAERQQVVGHRERRGTGADQGHALAVLLRRRLRQAVGVVVGQVGRHALQPADGDRLVLDPAPAAGRLAGPVADAPENAREDVRLAVEQEGLGVLALGDQPDVARHIGVRGARPLAVHHLVKVVRILGVGRLHDAL